MGRDVVINYLLQYDSNDGSGYSNLTVVGSSVTTYTHSLSVAFPAFANRSSYYVKYRVAAINNVGLGIYSNDLSVLTATYPK